MSLRLQLLQIARLSPRLLGDSTDLVRAFLQRQFSPDGGACDRSGRPDLYYTIFALAALQALDAPVPVAATEHFLRSHGDGAALDFVHVSALARCWASLGLDRFLTSIVGGDTLPVKKPDPAPLLAAIAGLGLSPGQALMVGDNEHDVATAKAAGVPVVAVSWGYSRVPLAELDADATIDDFAQLPAAIARLAG